MEVPAAPVIFVVRVIATSGGGLAGIVERVRTGERHRFVGASELSRLIESLSGAARTDLAPDEPAPEASA